MQLNGLHKMPRVLSREENGAEADMNGTRARLPLQHPFGRTLIELQMHARRWLSATYTHDLV